MLIPIPSSLGKLLQTKESLAGPHLRHSIDYTQEFPTLCRLYSRDKGISTSVSTIAAVEVIRLVYLLQAQDGGSVAHAAAELLKHRVLHAIDIEDAHQLELEREDRTDTTTDDSSDSSEGSDPEDESTSLHTTDDKAVNDTSLINVQRSESQSMDSHVSGDHHRAIHQEQISPDPTRASPDTAEEGANDDEPGPGTESRAPDGDDRGSAESKPVTPETSKASKSTKSERKSKRVKAQAPTDDDHPADCPDHKDLKPLNEQVTSLKELSKEHQKDIKRTKDKVSEVASGLHDLGKTVGEIDKMRKDISIIKKAVGVVKAVTL